MNEKKTNRWSNIKLLLIIAVVIIILGVIIYFAVRNNNRQFNFSDEETMVGVNTYRQYLEENQDDRLNYFTLQIYNAFYDSIYDEDGSYKEGGLKSGASSISLSDYLDSNELNEVSDYLYVATSGALSALIFDNPDLFWLSFGNMGIYTETSGFTLTEVVFVSLDSSNRETDFYAYDYLYEWQIDNAINRMEQERDYIYAQLDLAYPDGATDYETIMFFNDYLVENVEYDLSVEDTSSEYYPNGRPFVHTAYGALVNDLAVCDGYSYAMKYLLDGKGITNLVGAGYMIQNGQAGGHMWSYVYLYGNWYGLDVTWNDPAIADSFFEENYPYYSEEEREQYRNNYTNLHKHDYLLLGGSLEEGIGFYAENRIPQNYIYYFDDGSSYYQYPIPEISNVDFTYPEIDNIQVIYNDELAVGLYINGTGIMSNYTFSYSYSTDGLIYGDYVECNQDIYLIDGANGYYRFRICYEDTVLCEYDYNFAVQSSLIENEFKSSIKVDTVEKCDVITMKKEELVA